MKKIISILFVGVFLILLTGCENIEQINKDELVLDDPKLNPEEPLYGDKCLATYGSMVVQENLSPEDREWEGYHGLGGDNDKKVPTRMLFSADGNIKMYTKPLESEDWQLVKNFNVDRMRVPTGDKNIDDIIKFPKAVDYCLFEDTKENADKDFPCITLYPEGMPIQENSPFNVSVCIEKLGSLHVSMLKNDIYLQQ